MTKKILLLALLMPAFLVSCSDNSVPGPGVDPDSYGNIKVNAIFNSASSTQTRAHEDPAISEFTVLLTGADGTQEIAWPAEGFIENLESGNYTVKLVNHPDGMPGSGFGNDYWVGERSVVVSAGQTTQADVTVSMLNGGVFFNYDAELAGINIVPTVTDAEGLAIKFNDKTEEAAYFVPGNSVTLTADIDGVPTKVNGEDSKVLEIQKNHVWKVTLHKFVPTPGGDISIEVSFEEINIEDISFEVVPDNNLDYINLPSIRKCNYLGGSGNTKFEMEFEVEGADDLIEKFVLVGYADESYHDEFGSAFERTYTFGEGTAPGTVNITSTEDMKLYGSYVFGTEDGTMIIDVHHIHSGTVFVSYSGDIMTLTIVISGIHEGSATLWREIPFTDKVYRYVGPKPVWADQTQQDPPAPVEWSAIPSSGTYTMTTSEFSYSYVSISEATITGTFTKSESPKKVVLSHWRDRYDRATNKYPLTLLYDETAKAFYVDITTPVIDNGSLIEIWTGVVGSSFVLRDEYVVWVDFRPEQNKIDMSYARKGGRGMYLGIIWTGTVTGVDGAVPQTLMMRGVATYTTP